MSCRGLAGYKKTLATILGERGRAGYKNTCHYFRKKSHC
jgi:hypothetical protein